MKKYQVFGEGKNGEKYATIICANTPKQAFRLAIGDLIKSVSWVRNIQNGNSWNVINGKLERGYTVLI